MLRIVFVTFIVATLCSCSSDTPSGTSVIPSGAERDTAQENTSTLTRFDPDANWVTPTETFSQYGPSGIVRDVVIDRDGIIWLAAWDGIISYDGKEFTNHTLKEGLSHHRVYSVMEDSKGNMWFGTMGAGAYKYDGTKFTNLSSNNGMVNNTVFDIHEDCHGNIWFGTTAGASCYDGKKFVNLDSTNGIKGEVYAISQDRTCKVWIGGESGLYRYNDGSVREILTEYETFYSNVRDLYHNHLGDVLMGTSSGLYRINTAPSTKKLVTKINDKFTSYVCEDNTANMLITSDGLSRFDGTTYTPIVEDVSNLGIFGAREAKDGTIWYGAMDGLHSVKDGKDVSYKKPSSSI